MSQGVGLPRMLGVFCVLALLLLWQAHTGRVGRITRVETILLVLTLASTVIFGLIGVILQHQGNKHFERQNQIMIEQGGGQQTAGLKVLPYKPPLWSWIIVATAVLLIWMVVGLDYYDRHYGEHTAPPVVTQAEPYKYMWAGEHPVKTVVNGKHFVRERVPLDDIGYIDCTFDQVTFVYNGTAAFELYGDRINGYTMASDNPSLNAMLNLLYGFGALRFPVRTETGKPPINIQPPHFSLPKVTR